MCIYVADAKSRGRKSSFLETSQFHSICRPYVLLDLDAREISGQERPRDLNAIPRHEISLYYQSLWSDTL